MLLRAIKPILLFVFIGFAAQLFAQTTPSTALRDYLNNGDNTYAWEIKDSIAIEGGTLYEVILTSQKWREHVWKHQVNVTIPNSIKYDGALLFVSSGSIENGIPNRRDPLTNKEAMMLAQMAVANQAISVVLYQTPNQPLYGGRTEDELISYTFHKFQEDGDYSWPLLFPMVKSAMRAMDAVQEIAKHKKKPEVNRFVVTGLSKRGWTTWLTSSQDPRVEAFAPMVIDILNMPVNLVYQMETWQDYSPQIQDYVSLGLVQDLESDRGKNLATMIDPYSYRNLVNKPKMLFMGGNDPYWVIDAARHYIDDIPGQNFFHYVPNAGHNLGDKVQAFQALSAFWDFTLKKKPYNKVDFKVNKTKAGIEITTKTTKDNLVGVVYWGAPSIDSDIRDAKWSSQNLQISKKSKVVVEVANPKSGYNAFYIDFQYMDDQGRIYTQSTRAFVGDSKNGYYVNK